MRDATTTNRRDFLSAAVAVGAISSVPAAAFAAPTTSRARWDAAMAQMIAANSAYEASEDEPNGLCDAWADAERRLMDMPAPDRAALRWKLDHIFGDNDGEWQAQYSVGYVRQTVADYRRLLGDA